MNANKNPLNPADGASVVVQNNQRVTGSLSEAEARREADRLNKLNEASGQPKQAPAKVVKNLFG